MLLFILLSVFIFEALGLVMFGGVKLPKLIELVPDLEMVIVFEFSILAV